MDTWYLTWKLFWFNILEKKQKELDVLPRKHKFIFSNIVLFYSISTETVRIDITYYISRLEPQDIKQSTRCSKPVVDYTEILKYKCCETSYFARTVKNWNGLPYEIRNTANWDKF